MAGANRLARRAAAVVWVSVLGGGWLLGGCEDAPPGAGPAAQEDPCKQSCSKYAQCSQELREDTIRIILEGSGDDVKKTAFGYAKEDAKTIDAQCQKHCAAGETKKKIGSCSRATCIKLLACMAEVLPDEKEPQAGPHGCVVAAQSQCIEYTGSKLTTKAVRPACRAMHEGQYVKKDCPKSDVVGTCEIGKKKAEAFRMIYFYSTGKKPHTAKSAEEACVGEFKPAAAAPDASASATASAAASAAPPK